MKQNKFWLLTIAYCLMALAFALSLSLLVRRLPDVGQPTSDQFLEVFAGHPVTQTLAPRNNGINVITLHLKNVSLRNQDPFIFELSDASGVIRTIRLTGYNIGDGDNVRFQFDPILNSKDRSLTLTLTSPSEQKIAIGAGFSSQVHSLAYQSFYYPTNRLSILKSTTLSFLNSILQPRFIVLFLLAGAVSYQFCRQLLTKSGSQASGLD